MRESTQARRPPNLEDVAARSGVSRATVSRVVNSDPKVSLDLRERVEQAVEELGYVPNRAARSLMTRRSDTIAVLASESDERVFGDPFFSGIIRGVTQEATRAGLQVVLLMAQSQADFERVRTFLAASPVDGVMLISEHTGVDPLPAELTRLGIPFIIGGRPTQPDLNPPYVDNENVFGATIAARHLVDAGRRTIGTITGPLDMPAGVDRLQGFVDGLGDAFRPDCVEQGDFTVEGGTAAATRLLERVPAIDAIFAASDLTAMGALIALRKTGRKVPEDVALVGFDDSPFAPTMDPPLTTVRQDPVLQGRAMVRLFLARHRPDVTLPPDPAIPDLTGAQHIVLPVELVTRSSG